MSSKLGSATYSRSCALFADCVHVVPFNCSRGGTGHVTVEPRSGTRRPEGSSFIERLRSDFLRKQRPRDDRTQTSPVRGALSDPVWPLTCHLGDVGLDKTRTCTFPSGARCTSAERLVAAVSSFPLHFTTMFGFNLLVCRSPGHDMPRWSRPPIRRRDQVATRHEQLCLWQ